LEERYLAIVSLEKETTGSLYLQKVGEHGPRTEHTHLNSGAHLFIPFQLRTFFSFNYKNHLFMIFQVCKYKRKYSVSE